MLRVAIVCLCFAAVLVMLRGFEGAFLLSYQEPLRVLFSLACLIYVAEILTVIVEEIRLRHGRALTLVERARWLAALPERRRKRRAFEREFWRPVTQSELMAIPTMRDEELESLADVVQSGCRALTVAARTEIERRDSAVFERLVTADAENVNKYKATENPTLEQALEETKRRAKLFAEN